MVESNEDVASDVEALQSSGRGKLWFLLGLVGVVGVGAALYLTHDGPIGTREAATHVLVVSERRASYEKRLEDWGFFARQGTLASLEEEARQAVSGAEGGGVAAVMKLADFNGHAFVAFEDPAGVDFSGLDIAGGVPTFRPDQRFAVLSAGDLAFPHRISVDGEPSPWFDEPEGQLLSALVGQEKLAAVLQNDPTDPPDVIALRSTLGEALHYLSDRKEIDAEMQKRFDGMRAEMAVGAGGAAPTLVSDAPESVFALPLADGGTMLMTQRLRAEMAGRTVKTSLADETVFSYLPAQAGAPRVACKSLLSGSMGGWHGKPPVRTSAHSDALAVEVDGNYEVYKLDLKAAEPCTWKHLGGVRVRAGDGLGDLDSEGVIVRSTRQGRNAYVYLVRPGQDTITELFRSPELELGEARWIGGGWIAVPAWTPLPYDAAEDAEIDPGSTRVLLLHPDHPHHALRLDAAALGGSAIAAVFPTASASRLLVGVRRDGAGSLLKVDLGAELPAIYAASSGGKPPPAQDEVAFGKTGSPLLPLKGAKVEASELVSKQTFASVAVSPDGARAAMEIHYDEKFPAIATVSLTGEPNFKLVTTDEFTDAAPMFSADGKRLMFQSTTQIPELYRVFVTTRAVAVE